MKRHSLIGPLLLVLIGALFLARNLHPEWISFELFARYWPFLLIAWGLLRLIEVLVWKMGSKPLPAKGVSGGEWTLIIFICLVGTGLFYIHGRLPRIVPLINIGKSAELFGEAFDYPIAEQISPATGSLIVVEHLRGNLRIAGADTKEIKVSGRKTVRAYRQSEADEADRRTPVEIVAQGEQILIRSNQERAQKDLRVMADLEITVPSGSLVRASGREGDYDILNVGGVEVKSDSASVRVQDIAGNTRADVRRAEIVRAVNVKGNVEVLGSGRDVEVENVGGSVTVNGYYSGTIQARNLARPLLFQSGVTELRLERISGQLQMDLGDLSIQQATGPLHITARTKDIRLTGFSGEVRVSVERGDVTIAPQRPLSGPIDITTRSGNVDLTMPAGAAFQLEAVTARGEAENNYGEPIVSTSEDRGASLKGSAGKGPKVVVRTERGRISIRKG